MTKILNFSPSSSVIHPFLFVLIPLSHLYLRVVAANLPFLDFALLSCVVFSGTIIFFYTAKYFIGDRVKAGIITSLILTPFLLHKYFVEGINGLSPIPINGGHIRLTFFIVGPICLLYILKAKRRFNRANAFLNIMAIVSLLSNMYDGGTGIYHIKLLQSGLQASIKAGNSLLEASEGSTLPTFPDIYYIIADAHTSSGSLQRFWNYDESLFLSQLHDKGFYVASESHSNYNFTYFTLAAALNMDYVSNHSSAVTLHIDLQALYGEKLIKESSVVKLLADRGYIIENLSLFDLGPIQRFYSGNVFLPDIKRVWSVFFERTMTLPGFARFSFGITQKDLKSINDRIIARLKEFPKQSRSQPAFVYAHLQMPHSPYFCDANGKQLDWDTLSNKDKSQYLQYLIYTDKVLIQLVDAILANSRRPPIIILQGDHGSRLLSGIEGEFENFTILNAYYLPDGGDKLLYKSISPVNTFRVIFNKYLGGDFKLLDDREVKSPTPY